MKKMAVIIPTRGRPQNAFEVIESFVQTRSCGPTKLVFGVDDDDPELEKYKDVAAVAPEFVDFVYGPRLRMGGTLNKLAVAYASEYDVIGFMGDDHRPRTHGWDNLFLNHMNGTAIQYGNDLIQGVNLPTAVFMSSDIIKTLGYMVPPTMTHLFLDNFWLTLGRRLSRLTYRPDIVIEHVHPIGGKVVWDDGYREVNSGAQWNADEAAWNEYQSSYLDRDIHAIMLTW
jgi:hypothetical protein